MLPRGMVRLRSLAPRLCILSTAAALAVSPVRAAPPDAATSAPEREQPTARFERLSGEAQAAFTDGRFEDAIKLYIAAYDAVPDPGALFNIGWIHERKLGNLELAEAYYQRVLGHPDAMPELLEKAGGRLEKVREALSAKRAVSADPPPPPTPSPATAPTSPPAPAPAVTSSPSPSRPPAGPLAPRPVPTPAEPRPFPTGPVLTLAAGGLVALAAVAVGGVALDVEDRLDAAESAWQYSRAASLRSDGEDLAFAADALLLTGAFLAAGGIIWYFAGSEAPALKGRGAAAPALSLRLSPELGRGGAGLALRGSL
jgi:hypothetical protein